MKQNKQAKVYANINGHEIIFYFIHHINVSMEIQIYYLVTKI